MRWILLHFCVANLVYGASSDDFAASAQVKRGEAGDAILPELAPVSSAIDAIRSWLDQPVNERLADAPALRVPLLRTEAERARILLGADRIAQLAAERKGELEKLSISEGDKTLRWLEKTFGETPPEGRSLWISMHGGGNAPASLNDRQWRNQIGLYEPVEGIYIAPRAPTDTWNLWHEGHIDPLFQRLIDDYVALRGVSPDKVYLMGYSAGGDGVWQLAPRMADRFAAAAMMAGHPNEASLLGLRNLPFAVFVGGNDSAYNRNRIVAERAEQLDQLEKDDPGGYIHMSRVYAGLGHWMNKKDAEALSWMAQFKRAAWPKKIVWQQDDIVHRRFYWLQLPKDAPIKERQIIVATVIGQTVALQTELANLLRLRLSDQLLDLDLPITVTANGKEIFNGKVERNAAAIVSSLAERADISSAATAILNVNLRRAKAENQ
ncbi:MAG: dienelactone hydrolase family protein [Verrucomicrobia bacterium]|nr:dienelactone hydrolase family protein [Verrucomicrobiota bacterium]